mgnify:CR=1 FL=1
MSLVVKICGLKTAADVEAAWAEWRRQIAAANAFVAPVVGDYLRRLARG